MYLYPLSSFHIQFCRTTLLRCPQWLACSSCNLFSSMSAHTGNSEKMTPLAANGFIDKFISHLHLKVTFISTKLETKQNSVIDKLYLHPLTTAFISNFVKLRCFLSPGSCMKLFEIHFHQVGSPQTWRTIGALIANSIIAPIFIHTVGFISHW